jgi:hypothetical protein
VVGYATNDESSYLGFVVHPDGYTATFSVQTDPSCVVATIPEGINGAGTIAGWYYNHCSDVSQGFVMSPEGVLTTFESPGQIYASLPTVFDLSGSHWMSLDAVRDITGSYTDELRLQHGFVRNTHGTIVGFDPPEGGLTHPTSINDAGAITGFYSYKTGGPAVGFIRVP